MQKTKKVAKPVKAKKPAPAPKVTEASGSGDDLASMMRKAFLRKSDEPGTSVKKAKK